MKKVKITFREKMVAWGLFSNGGFKTYTSDFVLNTNDIAGVYSFAFEKVRKLNPFYGKIKECDSTNHTMIHWYWDEGNGLIACKEEILLNFSLDSQGKVRVIFKTTDNEKANARYNVEESFLKKGLIKKFGLL